MARGLITPGYFKKFLLIFFAHPGCGKPIVLRSERQELGCEFSWDYRRHVSGVLGTQSSRTQGVPGNMCLVSSIWLDPAHAEHSPEISAKAAPRDVVRIPCCCRSSAQGIHLCRFGAETGSVSKMVDRCGYLYLRTRHVHC